MNPTRFNATVVIAIALLVATAGCSGLGGIAGGPPATLSQSEFETHQSALQESGSATIVMNVTTQADGQNVQLDGVTKADFENDRAVANMTIPLFGGITIAQYYDGTTTYEKTASSFTGTQYNATAGDSTFVSAALLNGSEDETGTNESSIDLASDDSNVTFERVDGEEGFEGATVYRANQTELVDSYSSDLEGRLVNATMEVHRADDGVFNFIHLRLVTEEDGERQLTEYKLRITDLGETEVVKPEWVETAELVAGNGSS